MARIYVFADEAGNFAFDRQGGSRYFIIGSVTMEDCSIGAELLELRRELALGDKLHQGHAEFHASEDRQAIRNAVFDLLGAHDFRVDATILDKTKTLPPAGRRSPALLQAGLVPALPVRWAEDRRPEG